MTSPETRMSPTGLALLLSLILTLFCLKVFTVLAGILAWDRDPGLRDFLLLFSADALVVLVLFALLGAQGMSRRLRGCWLGRRVDNLLSLVAASLICVVITFHVFCFYVVQEWGSFLEPRLIEAALKAEVVSSIEHYVFSLATLIVLCGVVFLSWFAWTARKVLCDALRQKRIVALLLPVLALASGGSLVSLADPYLVDPAASSPLLLLLRQEDVHSDGLGPSIPPPSMEDFALPEPRPVHPAYRDLKGLAKGMDLIYVVLESCRLQSLDLYGYERETMPTLTRMGKRGLLFQNAYVNQPRSCKTMTSMILGTYPDPRLRSMTWLPDRFKGKDSILRRFKTKGYKMYFGTTVVNTFDNYVNFIEIAAGGVDRNVGKDQLWGTEVSKGMKVNDDRILIRDFLEWYGKQEGKVCAVLWTDCGHHPYIPVRTTFAGNSDRDRYDNCLKSSDDALAELLVGIGKIGRKDRAVIVSFGDHGEAFGEHVGDSIHGNFLYDTSVRIPCILYHDSLFQGRGEVLERFQVKDIPGTLLWLFGDTRRLHQSENIFSKSVDDKIYMTNIYRDFKMGMVEGHKKFVYHTRTGEDHYFDFVKDPGENQDLIRELPKSVIRSKRRELLQYYFYQIDYLNRTFPEPGAQSR